MMLYEAIFDPQDGEPVQYLGVYALRWRPEWGEPSVAFREAKDNEATLQAKDAQIEALVTALREITAMQMTDEAGRDGVNMFLEAQMTAFFAIKEVTHGS